MSQQPPARRDEKLPSDVDYKGKRESGPGIYQVRFSGGTMQVGRIQCGFKPPSCILHAHTYLHLLLPWFRREPAGWIFLRDVTFAGELIRAICEVGIVWQSRGALFRIEELHGRSVI
jgi:hypothetical protein